ncbi:hypothetical protein L5515_016298 [Caenorhabditis briggsae]|uniref:C2H2-type domain-containing protein n=1 Tax=Caenorhabditis briggsae TaxID=6238 RepID=A0AAE9JNF2_CAEBR|nr:hypothetical protein L5515_016298 [Caenorhabditis briggsae]
MSEEEILNIIAFLLTEEIHAMFPEIKDPLLKRYTCPLCSVSFYSKSGLYHHRKNHHRKYTCLICDNVDHSEEDVRKHMLEKHNHAKIVPCGHCDLVFESFSHLRHHHVFSTNSKRKCGPVEPIAVNGDNPGYEQLGALSSFEKITHFSKEKLKKEGPTTVADFVSSKNVLKDTFNKEYCTRLVVTALEAETTRMGKTSKIKKLQQKEEKQASSKGLALTPTSDSTVTEEQTEHEKIYQTLVNKAVEMILNRGTHSNEDLVSVSFWEKMIVFADFKVTNYLKDNASKALNLQEYLQDF